MSMHKCKSGVVFTLGEHDYIDNFDNFDNSDYVSVYVEKYVSAYEKTLHQTDMYDKIHINHQDDENKMVINLKQQCVKLFDKVLNLFEYLTYF